MMTSLQIPRYFPICNVCLSLTTSVSQNDIQYTIPHYSIDMVKVNIEATLWVTQATCMQ